MKHVLFWGLVVPAVLRRLVPRWFLEPPLQVVARHPWIALGVLLMVVAAGGFAVAASGVVPLAASSGHWAVTEWMLQFGKRRSVSTHALPIAAPALDDRSLILRGAGHYDLGCRPCHGTPRGDRPRVALAMLPQPPLLGPRVPAWSEEELFYIVKHGLKFTGMPAWPAQQRDDEVWAVAAFLRQFPEMSDAEYVALTRGSSSTTFALEPDIGREPSPPAIVRESCARCHGLDGNGRGIGAFPKIAGQPAEYLWRALRAYADGRRHSGIMASVVAGLTAESTLEAAAFYSSRIRTDAQPPGLGDPGGDPARGARIALEGLPARDIPACIECHGASTAGPRLPAYPGLAGQYEEYLVLQLELLQQRNRGGSEYVHLMHSFVDRLAPGDVRDAAAFFASTSRLPVASRR
jgi:cytochrome c553